MDEELDGGSFNPQLTQVNAKWVIQLGNFSAGNKSPGRVAGRFECSRGRSRCRFIQSAGLFKAQRPEKRGLEAWRLQAWPMFYPSDLPEAKWDFIDDVL